MTLGLVDVILFGLLVMVITALLAPVEAFAAWAGWGEIADIPSDAHLPVTPNEHDAERFIVFLDGISKGTRHDVARVSDFLAALENALPESRLITDVLPYSVFNLALTDPSYPLSGFWQRVEARKLAGNPVGFLINIRNSLQVLVSADWRYGLVYNLGMAKLILRALVRRGYRPGSHVPVALIGYSGGGQVAAGTASLIGGALGIDVTVISVAGVVSGSGDFSRVRKWYQIVSDRDPVERLGVLAFPMRWRLMWFSRWHRARREGRLELKRLDGAAHTGNGSYMDAQAPAAGGGSQLERTLRLVQNCLAVPETNASPKNDREALGKPLKTRRP